MADLRRTIEDLAERLTEAILAALRTAPMHEVLALVEGPTARRPSGPAKPRATAPRRATKPRREEPRAAKPRVEKPRVEEPRVEKPRAEKPRVEKPRDGSRPRVRRVELKILDVLRTGASFLRDEIADALEPDQRRLLGEALAGLVERGAVTQIGEARDALYVAGESRKSVQPS